MNESPWSPLLAISPLLMLLMDVTGLHVPALLVTAMAFRPCQPPPIPLASKTLQVPSTTVFRILLSHPILPSPDVTLPDTKVSHEQILLKTFPKVCPQWTIPWVSKLFSLTSLQDQVPPGKPSADPTIIYSTPRMSNLTQHTQTERKSCFLTAAA